MAGSVVTLDRHRLARQAREELFARKKLIPNDRQNEDWVRRAIYQVELDDRRHLDAATTQTVREAWLSGLMREMRPGPITMLEWLRRPPRKRSTKTLVEELNKLQAIRALAPPSDIPGISAERLRVYEECLAIIGHQNDGIALEPFGLVNVADRPRRPFGTRR